MHTPFKTPFSRDTFQGRGVLLDKMEAFFHASLAPMSSQLTFAICGLGTSTVRGALSLSPAYRLTLDSTLQG